MCTRAIYKIFLICRITRNGEAPLPQTPALVGFAKTTHIDATLAIIDFRHFE
jgi:hypothetical protein